MEIPITIAQELRDVLYVMKRNRTVSYVDNDDVPSSWPMTVIDQAIGSPVHGIATIVDSGGVSVDYLIIATYKGIVIFNGLYISPELSWKIKNFWLSQDKTSFRNIQLLNDAINQILYCILPDKRLLIGDYANGLDPQKIRWAPWSFLMGVNTISIVNTDEVIIGADWGA